MKNELKVERIRKLLVYDAATGIFTWKYHQRRTDMIGCVAGSIGNNGAIYIKLDGHVHSAQKLAWLHFYGELPCQTVTHKNGVKTDNRIENLVVGRSIANRNDLTADRLQSLLHYDVETGLFRWRRGDMIETAGIVRNGYVRITLLGHEYAAHRLAWLYVYGVWPLNEIDHIDMNRSNNRLANIRSATRSENKANVALSAHNTSGYKGVRYNKRKGRWVSQIKVRGKSIDLGSFNDAKTASEAYTKAAIQHFGEFARVA